MALNLLVLAAGLGTRLRPLTDRMPKPLVPIADSNGMKLQLDACGALELSHRFANAHHLSEQLLAWADSTHLFDKIFIEPEILGTGGPLWAVRDAGYGDELLVVNGDVYHNLDLEDFVVKSRASGSEIALLAHPNPAVNTLCVLDGKLAGIKGRFGAEEGQGTTFTGISWYSATALAKLQKGDFDIRKFWSMQMEQGCDIAVLEQEQQHFWIDMGSPAGYLQAVMTRLSRTGKRLYTDHPLPRQVGVEKASVHGHVRFLGTAFLNQCVLLGGTVDNPLVIADGAVLSNCIVGLDLEWRMDSCGFDG